MATLQYKSSLGRYRRYLQTIQDQPLLKASLFVTLSLLLVIGLIWAALRPTLTTIATLTGQIKQQRELEKKLDAKITSLKEAQAQLTAASQGLVYLNEAIPTSANISTWENSLNRVASESGVAVNTVSLTNTPIGHVSQTVSIPFKLSVTGQYPQIMQFLQIFQSLRRLIKIDKVDIAASTTEANLILDLAGVLTASP